MNVDRTPDPATDMDLDLTIKVYRGLDPDRAS